MFKIFFSLSIFLSFTLLSVFFQSSIVYADASKIAQFSTWNYYVQHVQKIAPRSEYECHAAAKALGYKRGGGGYNFAGKYNEAAGCYYFNGGKYNKMAFWSSINSNNITNTKLGGKKKRVLYLEVVKKQCRDQKMIYMANTTKEKDRVRFGFACKQVGVNYCANNRNNNYYCDARYHRKYVSVSSSKGKKFTPQNRAECTNAAQKLGLKIGGKGYPFAGKYATSGCYYYSAGMYKGIAYWGYKTTNYDMGVRRSGGIHLIQDRVYLR